MIIICHIKMTKMDVGIEKDRIAKCTRRKQYWQQSTLKKACCGITTRVHPRLLELTLNQYITWLAGQKARTLSWGHHRGSCVIQCGGWLIRIFSTLFMIMPLVLDRQAIHKSPQINIDNQFLQTEHDDPNNFCRLSMMIKTKTQHGFH